MTIQPKIIFIAAHSRSGSTLLDRVLGQEDGFFSIGEIRYIWRRSLIENQLCGCGRLFSECSFWEAVIQDAFGNLDAKEALRIEKLFKKIHSVASLPQICWGTFQSKPYKKLLNEWGVIIRLLYSSISKVSGAKYLIDSSKTPSYGLLLNQVVGNDKLFVIHLLRDPRAVSFSRIRKVKRPEIHWKKQYMGITPPYKTALQWTSCNILCELLVHRTMSVQIKYEDFVEHPESTLSGIINKITREKRSLNSIQINKATLDYGHTSSGNPMRFKVGEIEIVPDMEWKIKLPQKDWLKVSCISLPLLYKYSYTGVTT